MSWRYALFFVVFFCLPLVKAQENTGRSVTFKAKTELVVVPVLVRDKNGKHFSGLRAEEFTVLDNGAERKITSFEEVRTGTERMEFATPEPGTFTNVVEKRTGSKRVTILVLDLLNTRIMDQNYAQQQLLKYLSGSLDDTEPTAFFVLARDGLRLIQDFTSDPKILITAINKMRERQEKVAEDAADVQRDVDTFERMKTGDPQWDHLLIQMQEAIKDAASMRQESSIVKTLESMQQLARYAKGIPGRKALVWATGGFPFEVSRNGDFPFESSVADDKIITVNRGNRGSYGDVQALYVATWNALTNANVSLYPVDVRGLMPSASSRADTIGWVGSRAIRNQQNSSVDWDQLQSQDSLRVFADATGGKAFLNNNDLTRGFREAAQDSSEYYLLSYYLEHNSKPGWHKLSVKVKRDGAQVRARTGFYVTSPRDEKAVQEMDTYLALRSPLNYSEIPMVFRWTDRTNAKVSSQRRVGYEVELPANAVVVDESDKNHITVQFLALVRDADGKEVGHPESRKLDMYLTPESLAQIRESGVTYRNVIELPPGEYNVRFVVRDGLSGKMGSVSAPVTVEK